MKNKTKASLVGALLALSLASNPTLAMDVSYFQGMVPIAAKSIKPYGDDLFGDKVNLFDGSLQFEHTDLQLKGNDDLLVALTRGVSVGKSETSSSYNRAVGNWEWKLPRVGGSFGKITGWKGRDGSGARCSKYWSPAWEFVGSPSALIDVPPQNFWHGTMLEVPGQGSQELLMRDASYTAAPQNGGSYPLVTKQQWQIGCLSSIQNGAGEGFYAISPTGVRYDFDWMAVRDADAVRLGQATFLRQDVHLYASKVTDRFGNWVRYNFDPANPLLLQSIQSSDGRQITITNSGGRAASATDGTRTVQYAYSGTLPALSTVTLPDGRQWSFDIGSMHPAGLGKPPGADESCADGTSNMRGDVYVGAITHPSGAMGKFTLKYFVLSHADILTSCRIQNGVYRWDNPPSYAAVGLSEKEISGPGLTTMRWTFDYTDQIQFPDCSGGNCFRIATVGNPDGTTTRTLYGNRWHVNEGQMLFVQKGWNGTSALQTTAYTYTPPKDQSFPVSFGESLGQEYGDFLAPMNTPQQSVTVTQQGTSFSSVVQSFDQYARPLTTTKSGPGGSRSETRAYFDNPSLWVISQLSSVTSNGLIVTAQDYNAKALPSARREFGITKWTQTYNTDGTIASKADGAGKTTYFSNHKRGIAQSVSYPNGASETGVVNNIGLVTSLTDAAGYTTAFGYDAMGRLASITPPSGFTATSLVFEPVAASEYGLGAGHWRQTITKGNAKTIGYFDALWRPVMTRTFDTGNEAGTRKVTVKAYDSDSRVTFESFPQRDLSSVGVTSPGTRSQYDAIGRPTRVETDSELGVLATTSEYLTGFQTRSTNPRGYATTQSFWALDKPTEASLSGVTAPEGVQVTIARDAFGKPTSITRGGVSRSYVYDGGQRLCKTIEPEVGATIQVYDGAGNVAWKAPGQTLTSPSGCDDASVAAAAKISYTYDGLNQLLDTTYGDGSSAVSRTYHPDTKLKTVSSNGSTWTYTYNALRQLDSESLNFGGQTYNFAWGFNAAGDLSSLTYPSGSAVGYNPNGLGEATSVGAYATGITFHPNGAVAGYNRGNGIAHTLTQNTRGLPLVNRDAGVLQDQYSYDANGNVSAIADQQEGIFNRSMSYDGLDRLTGVSAPGVWGSASYTYDAVDNITSAVVGSRSSTMGYDVKNRLTSMVTNGVVSSYSYDALGNIRSKGAQTFTFDIGNRLTASSLGGGYQYDGHGRRTRIVNNDGSTRVQIYGQGGQMLWAVSQDVVPPTPATITGYTCASGTLSGTNCVSTSTYAATPNGYVCNAGDSLSGTTCTHTAVSTYAATVASYSCAAGDTLSGSTCYRTTVTSTYGATPNYSCNAGDSLSGSTCSHTTSTTATPVYSCPANYSLSGTTCTSTTTTAATISSYTCNGLGSPTLSGGTYVCTGQTTVSIDEEDSFRCELAFGQHGLAFMTSSRQTAKIQCTYQAKPIYSCPNGGTLNGAQCISTSSQQASVSSYTCSSGTVSGSSCLITSTYGASIASYSCNAGDALNGTTCSHSTTTTYGATANYTCNAGDSLSGSTCTRVTTSTYAASVSTYACNSGDSLSGSTCTHTTSVAATPNYSCSNGSLSGSMCVGGTTTTTTSYVHLAGKQIAETNNGVVQYAHVDALGSPVAHTSAAGALSNRTRFEAYGNVAQGTKPSKATSVIGFTGHVQDAETDLVYMQQRYYDPIAGRFLSIDPVVTDVNTGNGFGLYTYVENKPYIKTDPDGRFAFSMLRAVASTCAKSSSCVAAGAAVVAGVGKAVSSAVESVRKGVDAIRNESHESASDKVDEAVKGITDGLPSEIGSDGKPKKGQYVNEGGDAQADLDSLPGGDIGQNGQKELVDGSVAGVHTSSTTGAATLHVHRPKGKKDIKVRYPKKTEENES